MKNKKKLEEDEEVRRAKANIKTGFIIAVIVIFLFAIVAFLMLGLMSAVASYPTMGVSAIPPLGGIIHTPI